MLRPLAELVERWSEESGVAPDLRPTPAQLESPSQEITAFKPAKANYAGWSLDALECAVVHPPIEDAETSVQGTSNTEPGMVLPGKDAPAEVSMW